VGWAFFCKVGYLVNALHLTKYLHKRWYAQHNDLFCAQNFECWQESSVLEYVTKALLHLNHNGFANQ
jgi:hypothetical protein